MSTPTKDLQSLDPGAIVDLYELDCSGIGGQATPYRFHDGLNRLGAPIVWKGNTYEAMPVQFEGLDATNKGVLPRPTLSVSNVGGMVSSLLVPLDDLLGAKFTRKRTLAKYLDAGNGVTGATPDPNAGWPDEVFYLHQKTVENASVIAWTMTSALDCETLQIPRRVIQSSICTWLYKGTECGYAGALGTCTKTLSDCKLHFLDSVTGKGTLRFGGFPAASRIR